jgi:curved DNA-binding protein CbpA
MLDYYEILGISRIADQRTIKLAFKKLAFQHHPDRNAGDKYSEARFKLINEAYQTLSNQQKKNRYDFLTNYSYQTTQVYTTPPPPSPPKAKAEKTVYNRYGKYDWRNAPHYKTAPVYKIDNNYFRNQVISLFIVVMLSALIIGASQLNSHLKEQEALRIEQRNDVLLAKAQTLYDREQYRESLEMITKLVNENPIVHKFYEGQDQMVSELNSLAIYQFKNQAYSSAIKKLEVLKDFQRPMRLNTWQLMAECYMQLKEYRKAVHAYDYILIRDDYNIDLTLKIAQIYQYELNDNEKAIDYYNEARHKFKKFQSDVYGEAFEFIIEPKEVPEAYFEMFKIRANLLYEKGDYEEVIKDCNWATFLRPERADMYYLRAQARYKLNEIDRACNDIKRAVKWGLSRNKININVKCD